MTTPPPEVPRAGSRRAAATAPRRVVVVGNGMAGYKLLEHLAVPANRGRLRITVFGEEPLPAYDRVHLTRLLGGTPVGDLLLAPAGWYGDNGIDLRTGDPVVAVDRVGRQVVTASGITQPYDHLVLATGSRPHLPAIPGNDLPGVFVYRTAQGLEALRRAAGRGGRVAVLGGGLLGLEAAEALRALGPGTWVIERGTGLLARQLDPEGSRLLQAQVERLGIHVCTGRETVAIERIGGDLLLNFQTGECLRVGTVVVAVGIRPRDELAAAAGLDLGPRGGVAVDDSLRTSDPDVSAIGECASHHGTLHGLAGPAFQMAAVLAENLSGGSARFTRGDDSTWLKLAGASVATLGDYQASDGEVVEGPGNGIHRRLILSRGRLVGAVAIGDWPEQARIHGAILQRRRLWAWEQARFRRTGLLWPGRRAIPVAEWPESALVCNCLGVRRGALSAACAAGCATVEALALATGASSVCGSCRPLLAGLLGAPATTGPVPGSRALLAAAVLVLPVLAGLAFLSPFPPSDSIQNAPAIDLLWHSTPVRRVTGFSLLGVVVLSLLLSARKRIARFRSGSVGAWRAIHAGLGLASLLGLATHTGLRLGENLNRVLMLDFLALALAGSLAGLVTALERRLDGPTSRRLRAGWTLTHIVLTWPLPVLVGFHILATYYY